VTAVTVRNARGGGAPFSLRVSDVSPLVSGLADTSLTPALTRPTRQGLSGGANRDEIYSGEVLPAGLGQLPAASAYAPAVAPGPQPLLTFKRLDRIAPLLLSTPIVVLGRFWHAHGAAGSVGDASLFGVLSAAAAVVGAAAKSAVVAGTTLAVAGGLAAAAIAGYAHEIWAPAITWAAGTGCGYGVSWRGWRAEARADAAAAHALQLAAMGHSAAVQRTLIGALKDVRVAEIEAGRDVRVAEIVAESESSFARRYGTVHVAPMDPSLLTLHPDAANALAPVQVDAASSLLDRAGEKVKEEAR